MTLRTPADSPIDLLRFTTAGSVDDGKSTLVGRLLFDTKSIFDDQLEAVASASRRLGEATTNLALLTDGLRAEREQKITIDVAYRFFATRRRKFIIADTPGHAQYTRNMVTGASTADLAVVLVDASTGAQEQSHRHAFIASLLGIPHLIVAINKMDLVDFSETAFEEVAGRFRQFAEKLTVQDVTYIPISALHGDNVVTTSSRMPWYQGGPLLNRLETVQISPRNSIDFRFPVQCVVRPRRDFRGYAGTVASGTITSGEEVLVLPSRRPTRIASIETYDGGLNSAGSGDAVVLTLADDVDVSRGDWIVRAGNVPSMASAIDSYLCWMDATALDLDQPYVLAQAARRISCKVASLRYVMNVTTLHRDASAVTLTMNDIGRVMIATAEPLFFDSYRSNQATGSFVLIDPRSNQTVAAGMIRGAAESQERAASTTAASRDVVANAPNVARGVREDRNGHQAAVVWLTGLPGSGKTTIARVVERRLFESGHSVAMLDGDDLRHGLCRDLGFDRDDRAENVRRAGEVARLFFNQGALVLCAFVSPYAADRQRVRSLFPERFVEVFVRATAEARRARDPKGHYQRAVTGDLQQFTGVSAPYEEPESPELVVDTEQVSAHEAAEQVITFLRDKKWLKS